MKVRLVIIGDADVNLENTGCKTIEEFCEKESNELMENPYYMHGLLEIYDCAAWVEPNDDEEDENEKSDSCS